jgi:hypothetical protein
MAWYSVGPSSYGDLRGVEQFTNSERIALQFFSLKRDFDALPSSVASGVQLTVNEAKRSRPRQSQLYADYVRTGYPVAAYPFTSRHDEVAHGNALDVGVTMPDGSNRALTDAEFAWMHRECELRGFTWTGRNFGEPWHIEGATKAEQKAPYPNARPTVPAPVKKTTTTKVIAETEDMIRLLQDPTTKTYSLENMLTGVAEPVTNKADVTDLTIILKGNGRISDARRDALNERYFRKVGPVGLLNLGVREGVFTKAGK